MSDLVIEKIFEKTLNSNLVSDNIEFLWHAGEPLAAGLPFFEKAMNLIKKHNNKGKNIINTIQTNGTLINESWCSFFKKNSFNIGLSIDGPDFLHDAIRVTWGNKPSHKKALDGAKLLHKHNIIPGVVCVLTQNSLDYPHEIFNFFIENNLHWIGFNVEEIEHAHELSSLNRTERTSEKFYNFISVFYDLWKVNVDKFSVREFSDIVSSIKRKQDNPFFFRKTLETQDLNIITFDKYGNISPYSPEFSGVESQDYNNFIIGNIKINEIEDITYSTNYKKIQKVIHQSIDNCKNECDYFDICGGGFFSNKFFENGKIDSTETVTCNLRVKAITDVIISKFS
jgi:uncharacterized protein